VDVVGRWYRNAVIYSLDVRTFQDSNGDGIGDFVGLTSRLDYLARLGVTTLWLSPIHPTTGRDGGYDVLDHYAVDPALGSLGDFAEFLDQADERGLRVLIDLVVNHTSNQHPWFTAACTDPSSQYRDWYVWSHDEPPDRTQGMVFPGVQKETWTYDEAAGAWYFHRFYDFEPDLNICHPAVKAEILKIAAYWVRMGVSGFRMDAAPFVLEQTVPGDDSPPRDYAFLVQLREELSWNRGNAVLLAEANVPDDELLEFFGDADGSADRVHLLFGFRLNQAVMLALAREDATVIAETVEAMPELPRHGQWATFLRNHDEVDLSNLSEDERADVFAAFGPDPDQQLYGRGIRRRLAPMLGGDRRRLEMAYSLQFTMPGTPVLRYGDELGMGEDLSLPERTAIRTPMQWSSTANGGFSTAPAEDLTVPMVQDETFGYAAVNVTDQRRDRDSLLVWFERMLHTLRECPEVGAGRHTAMTVGPAHVLVHQVTHGRGALLLLHNLGRTPARVDVRTEVEVDGPVLELFGDRDYGVPDLAALELAPYGYRWIRLRGGAGRP
jgi:maltose alpha-D-glucosyltransferase / alpha-amylase